MRWIIIIGALVALAWNSPFRIAPPAVKASTAIPVGVEDLVANAELVFAGKVQSVRAVEHPGGRIDTEYVFSVERTFWGEEESERVLRLPGGILDDGRGMIVPGITHFSFAEEVLLAVSAADPDGMRMPVGLDQGSYRLRIEPNGDRTAWHTPSGSARIDPATGTLRCGTSAWGIPYGELVAELTAAAAARRAGLIGPMEAGR